MKKIFFAVLAIVLMFFSESMAHDWWLNKTDSGFEIAHGHIKDKGYELDPYEAERVISGVGYRDNGQAVPITITWNKDKCGAFLFPSEKFCAAVAFEYNKYWMKTTEGWKNDKVEGDFGVIQEGHSYKYLKYISKWQNFLTKPLREAFEIAPLQDPAKLKEGEYLPVKLFFMGQEIHEADISEVSRISKLTRVKADDGIFKIQMGPKGLQLITAKVQIPVKDKEIIWYAAMLTFHTSN